MSDPHVTPSHWEGRESSKVLKGEDWKVEEVSPLTTDGSVIARDTKRRISVIGEASKEPRKS